MQDAYMNNHKGKCSGWSWHFENYGSLLHNRSAHREYKERTPIKINKIGFFLKKKTWKDYSSADQTLSFHSAKPARNCACVRGTFLFFFFLMSSPRSAATSLRLCVGHVTCGGLIWIGRRRKRASERASKQAGRPRGPKDLGGSIEGSTEESSLVQLSTRKAAVGGLRPSGIDRLPLGLSRGVGRRDLGTQRCCLGICKGGEGGLIPARSKSRAAYLILASRSLLLNVNYAVFQEMHNIYSVCIWGLSSR